MKHALSLNEVETLINANKQEDIRQIFQRAAQIKQKIYGERLVLFAPLYISDHCVNDCAYCNFHVSNNSHKRRRLTLEEIAEETKCLIDMGHKRVLVEFGEDPENNDIDYICEAIRTIYSVKDELGNCIRRVNINIAATSVENYRKLKAENIGTYQLFQETYHRPTYEVLHKGPKADYDRQITAHYRAFEAGIDDLGIGVLFGLYDWRYEVLKLIKHAQKMEQELGIGPHTISVPRFRPADGVNFKPAHPVSDEDFLKLIAILRIAVPYTGMILSTREPPEIRAKAFQLGISQASAGSVCAPGGYKTVVSRWPLVVSKTNDSADQRPTTNDSADQRPTTNDSADQRLTTNDSADQRLNNGQFSISDPRPLHEVINFIIKDGLIPSFCTACYRSGRTGEKFMKLAKPGAIHAFCRPNALLTFAEYLEDYGNSELREKGRRLIEKYLGEISNQKVCETTLKCLEEIKMGKRDVYL